QGGRTEPRIMHGRWLSWQIRAEPGPSSPARGGSPRAAGDGGGLAEIAPRSAFARLPGASNGQSRKTCPHLPFGHLPPRCGGRRRRGRRRRARTLLLLRRDHHDHLAAFQARPGLDHDVLAQVSLDARGHAAAELLVAHFAAAEADVDLDLVAFLQEAAHLAQLDLVVALVGHRTELDFLDLDLLRLLLGFVRALLRFEPELAEVHDLADRRIGVGLDLDQVQGLFFGHGNGFVARKHADHFAIRADHAHARYADVLIPAVLLVRGTDIAISVGGTSWQDPGSGTHGACRMAGTGLHDT